MSIGHRGSYSIEDYYKYEAREKMRKTILGLAIDFVLENLDRN